MPLSPVMPAQRVRSALVTRLADSVTGFNPYLAAICQAASVPAFTINFSDDSANFVEGKYEIIRLFDNEELDLPLISIYQGPSQADRLGKQVIASTFSGRIMYGLDVHLMSAETRSQSQFDRLVSCVHDAVVNTLNDGTTGRQQWAAQHVLWNKLIAMGQPSRLLDPETKLYFSTLTFSLPFTLVS